MPSERDKASGPAANLIVIAVVVGTLFVAIGLMWHYGPFFNIVEEAKDRSEGIEELTKP